MKRLSHPLSWFIILIHAVYFVCACITGRIYLVDSHGYLQQSVNLVNHHSWYAETWQAPFLADYFSFRPPLYACFILICKSIVNADVMVVLAQNVLSILNMFALWAMLRQHGIPGRKISFIMVPALLLAPSQLIYAQFIMSEILLQTLLLAVFYLSIRFLKHKKSTDIILIPVLISLCMFTKPVVIMLGVLLFVFFAWHIRKEGKMRLLLPFLLLPLSFHLICLQNRHSTGFYHYSSAKVLYDLRVNARFLLMKKFSEDSSHAFVSQTFALADRQSSYKERYRFIERECNSVYAAYPADFALMYGRGMLTFFIDPGRFDLFNFLNLDETGQQGFLQNLNRDGPKAVLDFIKQAPMLPLLILALALLWNLAVAVCAGLFLFRKNIAITTRIFVVLFIGYFVFVSGISGIARYRVPVYPELLFAAAFVMQAFLRKNSDDAYTI